MDGVAVGISVGMLVGMGFIVGVAVAVGTLVGLSEGGTLLTVQATPFRVKLTGISTRPP